MAQRVSAHAYCSHVLVAVATVVFTWCLKNLTDTLIGLSVNVSKSSSTKVLPLTGGTTNQQFPLPINHATISSRIAKRIDLPSCPDHRLVLAARTPREGIGHRMIQCFYVFWYAMMKRYCYCIDTENFGYGVEIYHLLLEPVLPSCNTHFLIAPCNQPN